MDEVVTWIQRLPFGAPLLIFAALLTMSFLGPPWVRRLNRHRYGNATSVFDRWKLFSWVHPVWAGLLGWFVIAVAVIAAAAAMAEAGLYDLLISLAVKISYKIAHLF